MLYLCGIAGFSDFNRNLEKQAGKNNEIVEKMGKTIIHRGPDAFGTYVGEHVAFAHARLSVIDPAGGTQPMTRKIGTEQYTIIYNGELYNATEIRRDLISKGYSFQTTSDTEVLLYAYIAYAEACPLYLNGIFSFAIWDTHHQSCFLCRDRFGVKPLFYTIQKECLVFASEIKALFAYPGVEPILSAAGLCEIFGLGPARSPGNGVFQGIHEIPPAHAVRWDANGIRLFPYWKLEATEHSDTYEETVEKTRELLFDAIKRQMVSDVPICTLLSGGLDSSLISAVVAKEKRKQGKQLDTYSFDYQDNQKYFQASSFQPAQDRPFVEEMVKAIHSNHRYLECDCQSLYDALYDAVLAKDLPGMADVDSSLLYFCREIKQNHVVCLSGECADEVFGGYPWFRDPVAYKNRTFPWSKNFDLREQVLKTEILSALPLKEYVQAQYEKTMQDVPRLWGEDAKRTRQREIAYLNLAWFMTTLLDRKDRMTMASGLEVRVPYADHRLISYVYNIPWEYKYHNQQVKGLLRDVAKTILPDSVLKRKKSPYPKTYHPNYEALLKQQLQKILEDTTQPLHQLIAIETVKKWMQEPSAYGKPWFGQLMAGPQLYAYLLQINFWLQQYRIQIVF